MMYGREFWGSNSCFGFNYFPYWHLIAIGVIIILVFIVLKNKNSNTKNNDDSRFLEEILAIGEVLYTVS